MRHSFFKSFVVLVLAGVLTTQWASAQVFTGNITGVVTDQSNAVIVGAEVKLTNTVTGEIRSALTNDVGRYTFSQLLPSTYSLKVSMAGFKEHVESGISLGTNRSIEVNVELQTGEVTESVEVRAPLPLLDTQTATRETTFSAREMVDLPLNARQPLLLLHATTGVSAKFGVSQATVDYQHSRLSVDGSRHAALEVLTDGISNIGADWGGLQASVGIDSVQEMQVIRNSYDAQYGRTAGTVVNITSKGGSDEFHGTLFEFLRNDNLDANSFFNNFFGRPKTELKRNQFGGNIGGPVWKDKRVFFFFGYEGLRQGTPASRLVTAPTELQRRGDFSQTFNRDGSLMVIYDPLTTRPDPNNPGKFIRDPFPGNRIPSNRFDPVGANVVNQLFPLPSQLGDPVTGFNNFFKAGTNVASQNRYDGRIDWARSEKHTLFGRLSITRPKNRPTRFFDNPAAERATDSDNPGFNVSLANTFVLNPTTVVNVLIGASRWLQDEIARGTPFDASSLGFPRNLVAQFAFPTPPEFLISDFA
ncbi:MAG: carboxypeptidase regulatory-like domain-containing protein, partial [Acidobacteria bacterium]|nr:carboxypeptidase regulatory-like domain-containing protein [Acidobacteriota bacterium]